MGARPPRLDGDQIARAVSRLSRDPFREVLAELLEARPDPGDVKAFAKRYPDRWAQAVTILARLGGYHDKLQIDANLTLDVGRMSDLELTQRLADVQGELATIDADRIEGGAVVPFRRTPTGVE